jgi:predicted O-methyltransferase YrrM
MQLPRSIKLLLIGASLGSFFVVGCAQPREFAEAPSNAQTQQTAPGTQTPEREPDVVYVPTPPEVVEGMLELAKVTGDDVLYDLGSGDGRIPIAAAQKYGTRGVGIDINPQRIQEANENAKEAGVTDKVQFRQQDLFQADFSEATVVTLYLLPELNVKLRPRLLQELKPGTRIVSHAFDMGEWKPERTEQIGGRTIYLWVVPENPPANLL